MRLKKILHSMPTAERLEMQRELSDALWPKASKNSKQVNLHNLVNGATKLKGAQIPFICQVLKITPNQLYGVEITDEKTVEVLRRWLRKGFDEGSIWEAKAIMNACDALGMKDMVEEMKSDLES